MSVLSSSIRENQARGGQGGQGSAGGAGGQGGGGGGNGHVGDGNGGWGTGGGGTGGGGGGGGQGGIGGAGEGGGLLVAGGTARVLNDLISQDSALGGSGGLGGRGGSGGPIFGKAPGYADDGPGGGGGNGGPGGSAQGGGIFVASGSLGVETSTITANSLVAGAGASGGQGGAGRAGPKGNPGADAGPGELSGGGLYVYSGQVTLESVTIADNPSGVVQVGGTVQATDALLADNGYSGTGGTAGADYSNTGTGSAVATFSLFGTTPVSVTTDATDLIGVNPLLSPLGDYGGPTETIALLPGSPAIGAGTAISGITTDQRGLPLDSPNPDIGAFQSQGFTLALVRGSSPQAGLTGWAFANPLAVTVRANNPVEPLAGGIIRFSAPVSGASAVLSSGAATIGSNGAAAITATANETTGSYTVTASATGAAMPASFALTNATMLLVVATQPPAGVLAGHAFSLTVDVLDLQDQIDRSYDGTLTVSFANNPGASVLGGSATAPVVNGVATFSGLTISNPGLAYALQVSATGVGSATTANIDVAGYQLVASGASENLVWYGTSGSDQVQFAQPAAGTVQITVSELAGIATSFTATITGVTGSVVANEYDVAGDADVVDGSGLTTIPSTLTVGNGNDTVIGGGGANTIIAGDGDNTIYGNGIGNSPNASGVEDPSNTITVGNGNNIIYGNYSGRGYQGGNNTITAGDGNNTIYGNYGEGGRQSFAFGEPFFDGAEGSNNTIKVGNGDNTIYGNYGTADGGEGGSNTIIAGNGNDVIFGNAGGSDPQRLCGSNFIQVGNGNDTIYGNLGGDGGEGGNNTILTGSGQDTIYGNFGGDGGEGGNNLIVAGRRQRHDLCPLRPASHQPHQRHDG